MAHSTPAQAAISTINLHQRPALFGFVMIVSLNLLFEPRKAHAENSDLETAVLFLNRYSTAFTLHYLCDRNPLAVATFGQIPADQLGTSWAGELSPQLMLLLERANQDATFKQRLCTATGPLVEIYREPDLSDPLLRGLRQLAPASDGRLSFENGVYYRLRGYDLAFEQFVQTLHRQLVPEIMAQQ